MVEIRRAESADAEQLVELGRAVGSEPQGWLIAVSGWRSVADERRYLKAIRRYPHAAVFVAEDDGVVVGRLSLARDQHPASAHVADLGLMVAQTHRRRGIGRALLQTAVGWNEPAIKLYENFGFEREGHRKNHYRRGRERADAILMAYAVAG